MLRVTLGVTGGIAAFKAASIIRGFTEAGHQVKVIPTANALRFIGATTLEALSHNVVDSDIYTDVESVKHVQLGQDTDLVVVAPATAAFIARFAAGIADDLLLNTLLVTKAPVLVVPAMHTEMWQNPATAANVTTLRERGVMVLDPDSGRLTGQDSGPGRMPEPEAIVPIALSLVTASNSLAGKRVLVTAGGTREPIDPVRFIGNTSSGKQGVALALAAKARGAAVTLIGANLEPVSGIDEFVPVQTAMELSDAVLARLPKVDMLVMTAAVADYRVEFPQSEKIKREGNANLELALVANEDILKKAVAAVSAGESQAVIVGFAAETAGNPQRLAALAEVKLTSKGCDVLVANDVASGAVFGTDHNSVLLLSKSGASAVHTGTKLEVAGAVLDFAIPSA